MAVDLTDTLHVTHFDLTKKDLVHSSWASGSTWSSAPVISSKASVGNHSAVAADKKGGVHVVFLDSGAGVLMYAHRPNKGAWTAPAKVDANAGGEHPSLVVDSTGSLHVVHFDPKAKDLRYAYLPNCP